MTWAAGKGSRRSHAELERLYGGALPWHAVCHNSGRGRHIWPKLAVACTHADTHASYRAGTAAAHMIAAQVLCAVPRRACQGSPVPWNDVAHNPLPCRGVHRCTWVSVTQKEKKSRGRTTRRCRDHSMVGCAMHGCSANAQLMQDTQVCRSASEPLQLQLQWPWRPRGCV